MEFDEIRTVGVIGAGIMGHGIAQTFALAGYQVTLYDVSRKVLKQAVQQVRDNLKLFVDTGLITLEQREAALARISPKTDLAKAVGQCEFVVEAVPEILELKQEMFKQLDVLTPAGTILASNTSALSGSAMAEVTQRPDKVVVTHWFNPPHLVPVVEVVKGTWTSQETMQLAQQLMLRIGKQPVVINKEIPGFVANRIQGAIMREALKMLAAGIASMEDIDMAIKGGPGFRLPSLGIFQIADHGGLDTWARGVASSSGHSSGNADPVQILREKLEKGELGIKTGKGFYDYSGIDIKSLIEQRDRSFIKRLQEEGYTIPGGSNP